MPALPRPPMQYSQLDEAQTRRALEQADRENYKTTKDIELTGDQRFIMASPDGTRWAMTVSNAGATVWTAL